MAELPAIKGLVLAGGQSRRMGTDKALLSREGKSQLQRAVELLAGHLDDVYVSARPDQANEPERRRYALIVDRYQGIGPMAGILSAMDRDATCAWLVLACDLPNIDDVTLQRLIESCAADHPFTAYRSSHDSLPEPLCAIYMPASRALIDEYIKDGIVCPRKMLIRSDTQLLEQPSLHALDNMNSPSDLAGTGIRLESKSAS